jgi:transcriptional regulator with XRE-family HTH domain
MPSIHSPEYIELVTNLRNARKRKGLAQAELASLLGKPQSFISKVETCERRLDVLETIEWCTVLDTSLADVLPQNLKDVLLRGSKQTKPDGLQKGGSPE